MGVEERTALTVALRGVYRLGEGTNPSCLTTASSFRYPGAGSSWRLVGCLGAFSRSIVWRWGPALGFGILGPVTIGVVCL